jgi:Concanavalin A-like lectin/glucanases superfamily
MWTPARSYHPRHKPQGGQLIDPEHPLARQLRGMWVMNEGAGLTTVDAAAGMNNGTLVGGTSWGSGQWGSALTFNGSTGYVSTGYDFSGQGAFTLAGWFRRNASLATCTVSQSSGTVQGPQMNGFSDGNFYIGFNGNNAAIASNVTTWVHFVFTFDGTKGNTAKYTIYLNGVNQNVSPTITDTAAPACTVGFRIGNRNIGGAFTNGQHDIFHIYSRAIPAGEALWLYQEPFAMFLPQRLNRVYLKGFQAAWAVGANRLISGGVSVS